MHYFYSGQVIRWWIPPSSVHFDAFWRLPNRLAFFVSSRAFLSFSFRSIKQYVLLTLRLRFTIRQTRQGQRCEWFYFMHFVLEKLVWKYEIIFAILDQQRLWRQHLGTSHAKLTSSLLLISRLRSVTTNTMRFAFARWENSFTEKVAPNIKYQLSRANFMLRRMIEANFHWFHQLTLLETAFSITDAHPF